MINQGFLKRTGCGVQADRRRIKKLAIEVLQEAFDAFPSAGTLRLSTTYQVARLIR
jgi:hypothetical protein